MLEPQVIPTQNGIFNQQPFGSNLNVWGTQITDGNWATADAQLGGSLALDLTGLSAYTLTAQQALYGFIKLTGTPTGNLVLTVPNQGRQYIIENSTSFTVTVLPYAGVGAAVQTTVIALIRVDKTTSTATAILFANNIFTYANAGLNTNITGFTGLGIRTVTANTSVVDSDYTIVGNCTSGAITITLPGSGGTASIDGIPAYSISYSGQSVTLQSATSKRILNFKKPTADISANQLTLSGGGETWVIL